MSDKDNDDWVTKALTDTSLVADFLLRMRSAATKPPFRPLQWTVRQKRSRPSLTKNTTSGAIRASPSTPLSWSSGGDLCEVSKLKELVTARSKVPITCETTTTTKRSRKKKTLAELKEEETLLSKEKRQLTNELEVLRFTVEKERATNERLKRMKLDLQIQQPVQLVASSNVAVKTCSDNTPPTNSACGPSTVFPAGVACNVSDDAPQTSPVNPPSKGNNSGSNKAPCVLPDLNMPAGEDASSAIFCEVS